MRFVTLAIAFVLVGALADAAEKPPAGAVPHTVLDETAGKWFVDRFAGNSTGAEGFIQGPARQTGGLGRCAVAPAPDGSVYLAVGDHKWVHDKIVRVSPEGQMTLLAGGGSSLADGPARAASVAIARRGSSLIYSKSDESLYFVASTVPAVRRLYQKDGEWFVETVAGSMTETGEKDGTGADARFLAPRSLVVTSTGTIYVMDNRHILRKVEKGQASTVARMVKHKDPRDGPLAGGSMQILMSGHITLGENDDTLYVSDHWHFSVRKIDLKAKTITTVAGLRPGAEYKKRGRAADGPALTHATFHSGCAYVCWDPIRKALWCGGPDQMRHRWLKDGWVKTVIDSKGNKWNWPKDSLGVPGKAMGTHHHNVAAVDAKGGVYIVAGGGDGTGVWRAYMKGGAE